MPDITQQETISLYAFHQMLSECYAVAMWNTNVDESIILYFVDYDEDGNPYLTNYLNESVDLSTLDDNIQISPHVLQFYLNGVDKSLIFLTHQLFPYESLVPYLHTS